ncbi:MAG: hypothetical protein KQH63_14335 [Desulfobulbaceae bacterium]|nr:hypothetical protein [Desulfobulbaceae bacterium]
MKRFSKRTLSILAACLLMTPIISQAAEDDSGSGTIDLSDTSGPGVLGIPIAAASLVRYDGGSADGMGYTTVNCTPGEVMSVASVSTSASPAVRLFFAARDSISADSANCPADNSIYQAAAATVQGSAYETAPDPDDLDTVAGSGTTAVFDGSGTIQDGWQVRGGS